MKININCDVSYSDGDYTDILNYMMMKIVF